MEIKVKIKIRIDFKLKVESYVIYILSRKIFNREEDN